MLLALFPTHLIKRLAAFAAFVFVVVTPAVAQQDTLFHQVKGVIPCKIVEVTDAEIKYQTPDITDDIIFTASKANLTRAVTRKGVTLEVEGDFVVQEAFEDQGTRALKLNVLGPLNSLYELSYEKYIREKRSWDLTMAFVGKGVLDENSGVNFRAGYKLLQSPNAALEKGFYAHILKGFYLKPEVSLSLFYGTYMMENRVALSDGSILLELEEERVSSFAGALVLNLGRQLVYQDYFLIDFYVGIGLGFRDDSVNEDDIINRSGLQNPYNANSFNRRGGLWVQHHNGIAYTAGIRIGIILN